MTRFQRGITRNEHVGPSLNGLDVSSFPQRSSRRPLTPQCDKWRREGPTHPVQREARGDNRALAQERATHKTPLAERAHRYQAITLRMPAVAMPASSHQPRTLVMTIQMSERCGIPVTDPVGSAASAPRTQRRTPHYCTKTGPSDFLGRCLVIRFDGTWTLTPVHNASPYS